ncbi:pyridoxamine 5'-phosphate oxidase family protein [uncultured Marinobacter sp.]|uniref:pyridoxamine 5'-phosphate oxidase family protein n=1 Tax=uncultured Marinobacter sp. TaxID=187379 RepID=UPI0030DDBC92|tara:strand:+ start:264 stop:812 length:549 start_codon:yes stop_codon:yes gene_type:complete
MAKQYPELSPKLIEFISEQKMFFVGTAGAEGLVNVSPKGLDSLRIVGPGRVVWLNLTGSGNESAAHVLENGRMTLMFCSFDRKPLILRLYGTAKVVHPRDKDWDELYGLFPDYTGARQIFDLSIDMAQTSCGYAVPFYAFEGDRSLLQDNADRVGQEALEAAWVSGNAKSLDGKDTGILLSE